MGTGNGKWQEWEKELMSRKRRKIGLSVMCGKGKEKGSCCWQEVGQKWRIWISRRINASETQFWVIRREYSVFGFTSFCCCSQSVGSAYTGRPQREWQPHQAAKDRAQILRGVSRKNVSRRSWQDRGWGWVFGVFPTKVSVAILAGVQSRLKLQQIYGNCSTFKPCNSAIIQRSLTKIVSFMRYW